MRRLALASLPALLLATFTAPAWAQEEAAALQPKDWSVHGQATYIWQTKPAFPAAYSGLMSLSPHKEKSYSFTSTLFLGKRLGPDTEVYFNPELVQGVPMSHLTGLGGLTNSELQKTAGSNPVIYRARLFLRHTWNLGGGAEAVEGDANQLAGWQDKRRLVLTAGNFAASDIFDNNGQAHDGRTQFMNWAFLTHGAWDFAADARGYSWGAALEYTYDDWTLRAGRFAMPRESNGLKLDSAIFRHHGDQIEVEHRHTLGGQPGAVRALVFRNRAVMGYFQDAINWGLQNQTTPAMDDTRTLHNKTGWGLSLEQMVTPEIGVFARWSRNDGRTEVYAFAEIDQAVSAGVTFDGKLWGRASDAWGLAYARNGISKVHQEYLALGGVGFFVGDGQLTHYAPEQIFETYYRFGLPKVHGVDSAISLGWQHIRNPAYNADRGPVNVYTARLHAEF
jgi:high affinity Mn2+ porin